MKVVEINELTAAEQVAESLLSGSLAIVPTDTVYGIAAIAASEAACAALSAVKGRDPKQPIAVIYATVDELLSDHSQLSDRIRHAIDTLLPGPWTLIVPNASGRYPWLCGSTPEAIGVRVPAGAYALPPIAATSANLAGEPEIENVADVPAAMSAVVNIALDAGVLPSGEASTVIDLTAWESGGEVRVLRDPTGRWSNGLL